VIGPVAAGRNILITGAASGIGAGLADELARMGHHVVVSDLGRADVERVAGRIREAGGSAEAVALDVTADDSVAAALRSLSRPIDVLVNNAGLQHVSPLEEFPLARWDFLLQVMLTGAARSWVRWPPPGSPTGSGPSRSWPRPSRWVQRRSRC
jgi:3-hydroxybutyrate dehydrogenase